MTLMKKGANASSGVGGPLNEATHPLTFQQAQDVAISLGSGVGLQVNYLTPHQKSILGACFDLAPQGASRVEITSNPGLRDPDPFPVDIGAKEGKR